jgi:Flp pilus assembly pilin Flp
MEATTMITQWTEQILMRLGSKDGQNGQALIEYSLIMVLVVCVILVTLIVLGNQVRNTYCNIAGAVVNP